MDDDDVMIRVLDAAVAANVDARAGRDPEEKLLDCIAACVDAMCAANGGGERVEELTETVCLQNAEIDRLREELGKRTDQLSLEVELKDGAQMPKYAHDGDVGMVVRAFCPELGLTGVPGGLPQVVRTGILVNIPRGYVGLLFPSPALGSRGVTIRNSVGVIDSGYCGEVVVNLLNTTAGTYIVRDGDPIAQLAVMPVARCELKRVEKVPESERADGLPADARGRRAE